MVSLRILSAVALGVLAYVVPISTTLADKNGNNAAEEKREREKEQQAEREVKAARDKMEAAKKSLAAALNVARQAESARDNSARHIKEVRDRLAAKHQQKSGFADARERQAKAKADLDRIAAPILSALKESNEYRQAVEGAAIAKRLIAEQAGSLGEARAQKLKEDFLRPGELERNAIAGNSEARAAREQLTKADEAVAAAKKRLDEMIESDSELRSAQRDLESANKHLDDAKQKAAHEQKDYADANRKVSQEVAQLNQVKNANRLDDLRDKQAQQKKKNNNNKGKKK